jgi:serine/threonine protein kinase
MAAEIDVGRLVAGKYELVRLIGKGAMGEVWLATHDTLGGEFAIKLVQPSEDEEDESAAGRFQLEAQISAKLSRKTRHIVSVSDHGEEDGLAYLVMELLEGESLEARIKRGGALDLAEATAIVMQVARALGQAHAEQIFHRDLKPANVFLTRDEDGRLLVKLLDFGIARTAKPFRTRSPFATGKDMVLGTPSYMSPEQARGLDSLDHRCDLWALAVVAYEALTGRIPWEGETVEDIFLSICTYRVIPVLTRRSDLPPMLEGVFTRAFASKLDARFSSATELSEAFEALSDPAEVEAAMGPPLGRAPSSRRLLAAPALQAPDSSRLLRTPGAMELGGDSPGTDPIGMAVGGPTLVMRKRRSSGWLLAAVAAVATIGVVVLALTAFRSRETAVAKSPPGDATSTSTTPATSERGTIDDRANVPPPEPAPPTMPRATSSTMVNATSRAPVGGRNHGSPPAPPPVTTPAPPPTVVVPPVAPVVMPPAPPSTPAPPTPRKPTDKSEVF